MPMIETVNGPVSRDQVTLICPHEHLLVDGRHEAVEPTTEQEKELFYGNVHMDILGVLRRNPYVVQTNLVLDEPDTAVTELGYLKETGCDLLVDVTVPGINRDIEKIRQISQKADLNVVVATGLFVEEAVKEPYLSWSVEQIRDWMIDEIENGIEDSSIKPGVYKIATSEHLCPLEIRTLEAVAAAYQIHPMPVYVHVFPWSRAALDAISILAGSGVPPEKICICHLDVSIDLDFMREVFAAGVVIEFDNFSKEFYFEAQDGAFAGGPFETDRDRIRALRKLIAEGYCKRLLLANDVCLKASLRKYGGWSYDHVFRNIIPMMRQEGVDEDSIHQLIYENPKCFLFDF